jgi:PAS domain S-box-containing protein
VFTPVLLPSNVHFPHAFLPLLALTWIAVQYPIWPTTLAIVATCSVAILGTNYGTGPFEILSPFSRTVVLWMFVSFTATNVLLVSALLGEQKKAARQFAEAAREYGVLVEDTPAMIVRYTTAGIITFANQTVCTFLGQPKERVVGRKIVDFVGAQESARIAASVQSHEQKSTPLEYEGPVTRQDGAIRFLRWSGRFLHTTANGEREYQTIGIDLTDQRESDEEKKLFETQMVHAQKLESLGVMAGGIAHDFNNLLTGIGGFADLAASTLSVSSPALPHLERVREATARAAGLARQMLAYAGKATQTVRIVDLNKLIKESARLLESSVPKKCTLQLELSPDHPTVTADPTQLSQVVMNLVINAGEAIGDRPGHISLWTGVEMKEWSEHGSTSFDAVLPPGRYAVLVVTDTGSGMTAETKRRIFDPFFTTKFTGRGLGLAAVLGIVRGHKGAIQCESAPGRGTRFRVLLPMAEEMVATVPEGESQASGLRPVRAGTVLVVDDEDTVRQLAGSMMEMMGWKVVSAANGREAVRQFRGHADQFDLVLLDLTMPEMDGLETLAELRRIRAEVPVVLCSGYTDECLASANTEAGPPPLFLPKPFRMDDLMGAVAAVAAV